MGNIFNRNLPKQTNTTNANNVIYVCEKLKPTREVPKKNITTSQLMQPAKMGLFHEKKSKEKKNVLSEAERIAENICKSR